MRQYACGYVVEAFSRPARDGSAHTSEIIVGWQHACRRAIWSKKREIVRFDQHLKESIVPTDSDALLRRPGHALVERSIKRCDTFETRFNFARRLLSRVALRYELHQSVRSNAAGDRVIRWR
jgi:hypothetical protein